jgi:hypothetical protein
MISPVRACEAAANFSAALQQEITTLKHEECITTGVSNLRLK